MSQVISQANPQTTFGTATARARTGVKPTILIAEDSKDARDMMRTLLTLKGYDVVVAEDGVQAIDMALKNLPDLILIDLELPRLDGLSVIRNIRRSTKLFRVPIIIVSGHDPAGYLQPAIDAGCSDYLPKPIDFERLDTMLNSTVPLSSADSSTASQQ